MATHRGCPLIQHFFLLTYIASMVAGSSEPPMSHKTNQRPLSYYPQPRDFQSEQLHRAYFAIQRFKNTITCDPENITTSWTGHDICAKTSYLGFHCGAPDGQANNLTVTSVIFNGFGLCSPSLHGFIDQLPDLALFQASTNKFGGEIPSLTGLIYQYKLDVRNKHSDQYFAEARGGTPQTHLTSLCLYKKCLDIRLPPLGSMLVTRGATSGKALLLNNNQLQGQLPANFGFSTLSYLALANNKLTGLIPPSIGHMQDSLFEVLLLNNQLSGCLPQELGILRKATVIDVGMNQLTGPIPTSFSCLTSVEQLNLAGNRLYGEIPDALCKLAAGPAGRLEPADGVLNVKNNCIPGFANQRRPAECASFLSQPKTCPAASAATHVACPAAAANAAAAPADRVAKDYSSYVTYATLHK
uniref:Leucine-rich repeat-containing N-terminal plant-type domain-containing protein n=1 Tax=Oryza rufipogon TaxID=4529 RepID=A0A0E0R6G2_ORYRU